MYEVGIVFDNGSKLSFYAQEFDVRLGRDDMGARYAQVHKLTYKNTKGEESPIYLNPEEVAGIVVVPTDSYNDRLSFH